MGSCFAVVEDGMQVDYPVDAHAVGVGCAEVGGENTQGLCVGAIEVVEAGCIDEVDSTAVHFKVEDIDWGGFCIWLTWSYSRSWSI